MITFQGKKYDPNIRIPITSVRDLLQRMTLDLAQALLGKPVPAALPDPNEFHKSLGTIGKVDLRKVRDACQLPETKRFIEQEFDFAHKKKKDDFMQKADNIFGYFRNAGAILLDLDQPSYVKLADGTVDNDKSRISKRGGFDLFYCDGFLDAGEVFHSWQTPEGKTMITSMVLPGAQSIFDSLIEKQAKP
jgi:hypothetical protein